MRNILLGTDWWTDCDDAVALRILCRAHKKGEICLKGIGINACMQYSAASVDGFLSLEGVFDVPIGIDLAADDFGGNPPYQKRLSSHAARYKANGDAEDALRLYRRVLAEADGEVEIIEIGYLQVIADVLESGGDDISPMSGIELFEQKVSKVWVMAGKWDEEGGLENNFCRNERSRIGGKKFCRLCPVPVTFLGFEAGQSVISGGDVLAKDDHLYLAMCDHKSQNGRSSWDPMTVCLALAGDEKKAGYGAVFGTARVDGESGANYFEVHTAGKHAYVTKLYEDEYYKKLINDLIKQNNFLCI